MFNKSFENYKPSLVAKWNKYEFTFYRSILFIIFFANIYSAMHYGDNRPDALNKILAITILMYLFVSLRYGKRISQIRSNNIVSNRYKILRIYYMFLLLFLPGVILFQVDDKYPKYAIMKSGIRTEGIIIKSNSNSSKYLYRVGGNMYYGWTSENNYSIGDKIQIYYSSNNPRISIP